MLRLRPAEIHKTYKMVQWVDDGAEGDKQKILEMLFDGLAASLATAKYDLNHEVMAKSSLSLRRARRIIAGLSSTLDSKYSPSLCHDLASIYRYMLRQIDRVESANDLKSLDDLLEMTRTLREAWAARAYPFKSVA